TGDKNTIETLLSNTWNSTSTHNSHLMHRQSKEVINNITELDLNAASTSAQIHILPVIDVTTSDENQEERTSYKRTRSSNSSIDKSQSQEVTFVNITQDDENQDGCSTNIRERASDLEFTEAEQSKLWLVHNREGSEVLHHWNNSYSLRKCDVEDRKYITAKDIFNIRPILKEAKGFELIERDFVIKFSGRQNNFIFGWQQFFSCLFKLYEKKLTENDLTYKELLEKNAKLQPDNDDKLHPDSITAIQFHLQASLMAPRANKIRLSKGGNSAGKVRFWKPTVAAFSSKQRSLAIFRE
ncbi:PREDICTED: uncharacterized protein LOC108367409, partial [Rhagoletis zephyria]|uniref:uncharacterized protein LOC108367409 n=1 Tax=Rhagoletis zephyria TaxID=28612 RepID=UPI0008118B9A